MPDYNYQQCGNFQRRRAVTVISPLTYAEWEPWVEYGSPSCGARYAAIVAKYQSLMLYQAEAAALGGSGPYSLTGFRTAFDSCVTSKYGVLPNPAITCPGNSGKCASECGILQTKTARAAALPGLVDSANNDLQKLIGQFQELCDGKPQSCA